MGCVILPSEIARLVYGYLVNENLNQIALQFLESSPYLKDCHQIVNSGLQFNTKLMGKELQDLLQEYSEIHNIVNKKVNLLCRSSQLYKRIKLRCENMSQILNLVLFWKYRSTRNSDNFVNIEKNEKCSNSFTNTSNSDVHSKSGCDVPNQKVNSLDLSNSSFNNSLFNSSKSGGLPQNTDNDNNLENTESGLMTQSFVKCSNLAESEVVDGERIEMIQSEPQAEENRTTKCSSKYASRDVEKLQKKMNDNSDIANNISKVNSNNCSLPVTSNNHSSMSELNLSSNVYTIDMNSHGKQLVSNEVGSGSLLTNEGTEPYENRIKIVHIEKENQSQIVDNFSAPARQSEGNLNLENGSVVFVSNDVGSVSVDQDRNQIIVIPIDCYKSQNEIQNGLNIASNEKRDFFQTKETAESDKNEIVFSDVQQSERNSMPQYFNESASAATTIDSNILTENDFLRNRHLMYKIEDELVRSSTHAQLNSQAETHPSPLPIISKATTESISIPAIEGTPLIILPQAVNTSATTTRYRSILPKKQRRDAVPPVVVVQPVIGNCHNLLCKSANKVEQPKETNKKVKKKVPLSQKYKEGDDQSKENYNMPSIKTPVAERSFNESKSDEREIIIDAPAEPDENGKKTGVEEKENLEKVDKLEVKKIETPVVVTRRNSKRLSLSTPRRRSHIRALEFETPPKTKEEKKSRTSPKVKIEQPGTKVERKSVRNTLFKSPIPETPFKSPAVAKGNKSNTSLTINSKNQDAVVETDDLSELCIPIATRSPNTKLSDAWESLTGVGCVIGQTEQSKSEPSKKMWDADLRCFISDNNKESDGVDKKRTRKPEKFQKDNRKNVRKKTVVEKKSKTTPVVSSPSKMSLTAKRNTYSINGNEEGSPIRSLLDDLKIVTPFKGIETIRPTEETPLTKLLRENISTFDVDLSMINTPIFPPTPSIGTTPDMDDMPAIGTNYYSPSKDFCKDNKIVKITDYFRVDADQTNKKDTKEMHEKVIDDLVSKAKEIIGIGKESSDDVAMKKRPSGKILSMVKIQMLTQCDKKLCENIPINEESNFPNGSTSQGDPGNKSDEVVTSDIKGELEEKRKRALKKIKVVKENLTHPRSRVVTRSRKRKYSGPSVGGSKKICKRKANPSSETMEKEKNSSWSDDTTCKEIEVFHSTPYDTKKCSNREKYDSEKKVNDETLNDIRQELPPYEDSKDQYPELSEKSRKKIHYVGHFLKLDEIARFLDEYTEKSPPKLYLKPSFRRFFQVFYKWLKHPHKHELNASAETKKLLEMHLRAFDKINEGLSQRSKRMVKDVDETDSVNEPISSEEFKGHSERKTHFSDDDEKDRKNRESGRKRDEDTEDGFVSILPLKKRKATVQQVETKSVSNGGLLLDKNNPKNCTAENVSQTQNFLQDIDVDRFLSQIHGQGNR
ncbi:hypothetical protein RUM43_010928 [Polyplax serrata]|uniref:LisH domain-containing protein n=1 Tax=Polyplax serrata TaxID=468196 RepID=A0AAN8NL78_POLSC